LISRRAVSSRSNALSISAIQSSSLPALLAQQLLVEDVAEMLRFRSGPGPTDAGMGFTDIDHYFGPAPDQEGAQGQENQPEDCHSGRAREPPQEHEAANPHQEASPNRMPGSLDPHAVDVAYHEVFFDGAGQEV